MHIMKKYKTPILLFVLFEAIAVSLWLTSGSLFYLLNFSYIGICIAVGGILMASKWKYARKFVQFTVGSYMLVFLGLICRENMQIEGFWYYLLSGVVGAGCCTTPLPRFSDRCCLGVAGAGSPAGQP